MAEEQLWKFRCFIIKCRQIFMAMNMTEDLVTKITDSFVQERQQSGGETISGEILSQRILLGKMRAATFGRDAMEFEDYLAAAKLLQHAN